MSLRLPYHELSAAALQGFRQVKNAVAAGPLDLRLIELVYLRISQINGCAFCLDMHAKALRARGESQERLDALAGWLVSERFDARERAALRWAEALTDIRNGHASDEDYARLLPHFSEQEISELTMAIAGMNGLNRLAIAMRQ